MGYFRKKTCLKYEEIFWILQNLVYYKVLAITNLMPKIFKNQKVVSNMAKDSTGNYYGFDWNAVLWVWEVAVYESDVKTKKKICWIRFGGRIRWKDLFRQNLIGQKYNAFISRKFFPITPSI